MRANITTTILSFCCIGLLLNCNVYTGQIDVDDVSAESELLESELALDQEPVADNEEEDGIEPPDGEQKPNPEIKACLESAKACRKECISLVGNSDMGAAVKECHKVFKECMKSDPDNKQQCREDFKNCRMAAGVDASDEDKQKIQQCMSDCKNKLEECKQAIQ